MPQLGHTALLDALSPRPTGAVVFLHGDEAFLRDEAAAGVVDLFLDPATRDFNFDQLHGSAVDAEALASMLATPPMMAEYRVVVVREAQGLGAKAREVVAEAARQPPRGLVLVLTAAIPSGSKAKFYRALHMHALSVEFGALDPMDVPGWLVERAEQAHGKQLELDAARAMGSAIGAQLGILEIELEKIAAYAGERPRLTLDDVRAVGGYVPRVDRWAWFDLIAEQRYPEAIRQLPALLESGESGVGLVIGITGQLLRVGLVVAGGVGALERELKPYQRWLARRIAPQARAWTSEAIDQAVVELLRTDRLLKTAPLTDRQAMEELLLRLAARRPAGRSAA